MRDGAGSLIGRLHAFLAGGSFAAFALSVLLCWEVLLIGIFLVPPAPTTLGAFAETFRVWCFGYDPATGRTQWAEVMAMFLPQLMLAGIILLFWWEPLHQIMRRPRAAFFHVGLAALLVAGSATGFALSENSPATGELPFPAEELRIAHRAPDLSLINQEGDEVALPALRGKVIALTAVYASCGHTCPAILAQAKASVAELTAEQLDDLRVVAVTLDPEHDSTEVLARLAQHHDLQAPLFNLVTGASPEVENTLDQMQIARERDPETGVINHANLFLLIDRDGKLAYRFGLGERQQRWLTTALSILLNETGQRVD
ncbi:MAG: SCO family protein [Deltaproteobacteria bacterium]|nr:SCO family protein [Deltaproteobacteria bacterium]MBW2420982.1 SCO family protein [Deltaproteobacteria bacterium]